MFSNISVMQLVETEAVADLTQWLETSVKTFESSSATYTKPEIGVS